MPSGASSDADAGPTCPADTAGPYTAGSYTTGPGSTADRAAHHRTTRRFAAPGGARYLRIAAAEAFTHDRSANA